jgi:DNA-directed RNA polymerase subunit beta
MEKNRIRPVKAGKSMRMSYSRQKEVLQMPNLIEVQKDSYQWFLDEGLKEAFADISPIADYSGHLSLEFVDFTLCEDDVKYTIPECKERDATYAAPLKVKVRLHNISASDGVSILPRLAGIYFQFAIIKLRTIGILVKE